MFSASFDNCVCAHYAPPMIFMGFPDFFVKTRLASWDEPLKRRTLCRTKFKFVILRATMFVRLHRNVHSQLFKYSISHIFLQVITPKIKLFLLFFSATRQKAC
ncbi:hypothetical protein SK629_1326 [Streptococcus mitis]|uniref:Uncharacterized protein n=1 Tax=Streptococcus mitis TaxID=28037 RepID=A0A081PVH5_STRMT|nr:hypothetical protein SK629_1326 [Streptococcus mitis]